jgi:N utilization substance protein B
MPSGASSGFGSRREDRETALGILYAAETQGRENLEVLNEQPVESESYVSDLIKGISSKQEEIDLLIERNADEWRLERMPVVDRALLRLAVLELLNFPETSIATVINEAVELAGEYSTENSKRFVNGLLSQIADQVRS